jgi:hypothetical protein
VRQDEPNSHPKANNQNIHVSPAVIQAASKDGEELFLSLRTNPAGLTQSEAEERCRATGPNSALGLTSLPGLYWPILLETLH